MKTIIIDGIEYNLTPKAHFKKGDWITNGEYTWKVIDIKPLDYILQSQNGDVVDDTISYVDEEFHLWTIQDAEDGDVLAEHETIVLFKKIEGQNIRCYCTYHYLGFNPTFYVGTLQNKDPYYPATKEQRDLLFQKMKEAGYEWDAEKKELKKIETLMSLDEAIEHCKEKSCGNNACALEHKQLEKWLTELKELKEQNPSWSEDDEEKFRDVIRLVEQGAPTQPIRDHYINWLKSIKPNHWKPSEEQMGALAEWLKNHHYDGDSRYIYPTFQSLYNELKKL